MKTKNIKMGFLYFFCVPSSPARKGGTLVVQQRDLLVRVRERPFAVGGMRHCFRVWNLGVGGRSRNVLNLVGKQSKYVSAVVVPCTYGV